jgi:hypothetical protein
MMDTEIGDIDICLSLLIRARIKTLNLIPRVEIRQNLLLDLLVQELLNKYNYVNYSFSFRLT